MIRQLAGDLVRLILPHACLMCGRPGHPEAPEADQLGCGLCRARLQPLVAGCARCAQPLPVVGPCRFCAAWAALEDARSAVWLDPPARRLVHALKYGGIRAAASTMAGVIARRVPARPGVLVPVPLGTRRLAERGYNQAALLAEALGRRWDRAVRPGLLARSRETRTQTALDPAARQANVAGAFAAARGGADTPIILVDDVLTTGATLVAAAAALHAAGRGPVAAVTFARAEPWSRRITDGVQQTRNRGSF